MTPKRPDDPDPFADTPLAEEARREMLEKLSAHMKPRLQAASDERRAKLKHLWDELREEETVEAFRAQAEKLLAVLDQPEEGRDVPPADGLIGGFLPSVDTSVAFENWDRPVLKDLPPASFPKAPPS